MSKLIFGVGFNSKGRHKATIGGANTSAYKTWYSMILRCYCPKLHARQPTYTRCTVSDEWLDYQDFADWFENHEYSDCGYQLDKDLLIPGNKIYAPETCCFVPSQLNTLLLDSGATRGDLPRGVCFDKGRNKFKAQMRLNDKLKGLGRFDTPQEAYQAYKVAKEANVKRMANHWQDKIADNVFDALMNWELDS